MTLAVCILFFERPDQTLECLERVRESGAPVYVWNNGSSPAARDQVARYARDHERVTILDSAVNLGVAAGRNRLIAHAREEWLLFLDSDVTVRTAGWTALLGARADAWPDVEAMIPRLFDVREHRDEVSERVLIWGDRMLVVPAPDGGVTNLFPGGAACVRRALFERVGLYDESIFVGLEDYELAIRALRSGGAVRARCVPEVLLHHDHRRARTEADAQAARIRYSAVHVQAAYERLLEKHGLRYLGDWRHWLRQQLDRVVGPDQDS